MADSSEGFHVGLIMGMVKQIGWPAFKALVAKLESQHPGAQAAAPKRERAPEAEQEAPEQETSQPTTKGWGWKKR